MVFDGLFNSTSPHVGIHLHSLSGVNGVLRGSLWKSLKTPDLMWCVYSRQHYCCWLICCLFALLHTCFCFSPFCHISLVWMTLWMKHHVSVFFHVCFRNLITHHRICQGVQMQCLCYLVFSLPPHRWHQSEMLSVGVLETMLAVCFLQQFQSRTHTLLYEAKYKTLAFHFYSIKLNFYA